MNFEWDGRKAEANYRRHGIGFTEARKVFLDPMRLELPDERQNYGEDRFQTIGVASGRMLVVVYTERGDSIRIISARKATRKESKSYEDSY